MCIDIYIWRCLALIWQTILRSYVQTYDQLLAVFNKERRQPLLKHKEYAKEKHIFHYFVLIRQRKNKLIFMFT